MDFATYLARERTLPKPIRGFAALTSMFMGGRPLVPTVSKVNPALLRQGFKKFSGL